MIEDVVFWIGSILLLLGGVLDVIASIGVNRFKNFYLRLHAVTIGCIGGGVYPLIGIVLLVASLNYPLLFKTYIIGVSIIAAILVVIVSPTGSHVIARAAHRSGEVYPEPVIVDKLREERG